MSQMPTIKLEDLISNNNEIFNKELKEVIQPSFTGLDNPEKYKPYIDAMTSCGRMSFPRQARLVAAATEYISNKKNKALILSSEMGTGKTDMGIKIAYSIGANVSIGTSKKVGTNVNFIMCPPHLVDKWEDEIKINFKNPKDYKIIKVTRWTDLVSYTKRDMRKDGIKYYFIVSRESAKLGYPKQVAVNFKYKTITKEHQLDGQTVMLQEKVKCACCPDCGNVIVEEYNEIDSKIPYKCDGYKFVDNKVYNDENKDDIKTVKCGAILRQVDKRASPKLQSRISIAEYIKRTWTKGAIELLIVDEMHEYKGGNTGQGNALAQMCSMSKKMIGLTGTLLNGYASSLFYLLYRFNPDLMNKKLGFDYNQVKNFVSQYGAHEEVVDAKEVNHEGVVTKMGRRIALKEKPKVSPYLLSVLLDMTIFLRLDEIKMPDGQGLPDYDESIELVDMEDEIKKPYMNYLSEISGRIRKDKRFLGNLATDAIAVPDMPFQEHSAQNEIFYEPPFSKEEFGYTNKEKRVLELVKAELSKGRKVLLYVHFSNKGVAIDLLEMLEKELPQYKHLFLKPTIAAKKRQAWINDNPSDVMICNPELVKTGLDLLQFPTIIFYETTYNVFTLKQASRRSWRIGQTNNVKVIFMAYANTPQHKALELVGAKISAANSLEGRLSGDDDLSAMGDDEDNIQLALAKAILKGESSSKDIKMNSIKNFGNDRDWDNFEKYYLKVLEENKQKAKKQTTIVEKGIDLILEDNNAPAFTKESMMKIFSENLLRDFASNDVYGGVKDIRDDKVYSTSYQGAFQLFEINKEYKDGKNHVDGITVSYKRDDNNYVTSFELKSVYYNPTKAPFEPKNILCKIDIQDMKKMILDSDNNTDILKDLLLDFVYPQQKNNEQDEIPKFDDESDYASDDTSNIFFYYEGKGKNAKKVEIDSAANLADYIPNEKLASGIQLSLF